MDDPKYKRPRTSAEWSDWALVVIAVVTAIAFWFDYFG